MALWTARDAVAATQGRATADFEVHGVAIDSRDLAEGDLFVALSAGRDGHDFVLGALEKGAAAAMVSRTDFASAAALAGKPLLVVDDTLLALEALGAAARRRNDAVRVAITGSVGKTTVKEMSKALLSASAPTHASVKSYNNHWGVPLTLARYPVDARFGVFEVGMNHAGEIANLAPQVMPHIAAITTVAPVHIEHFASEAHIADAKAEIFLGLSDGGHALIPQANAYAGRLIQRAKMRGAINGVNVHSFGNEAGAGARLLDVSHEAAGQERVARADIFGTIISWRIKELGDHWLHNGLCALAIAGLAGADVPAAAEALSNFGAIAGRGQTLAIALPNGGALTLVDEAYNANPTSMAGALMALGQRAGQRRVAILGDMLELGADEARYHAELADVVASAGVDVVHMAGPRMRHLYDALSGPVRGAWAETAADLVPSVMNSLQDGDTIMIKGSNGARVWQIVGALKELDAQVVAGKVG